LNGVDALREYDVIVIGSGSGMMIVDEALTQGLKVALVDKGPLGGTCLNVGCIPSKMLIYPADVITEVQEAKRLGITAEIMNIDFNSIMDRMRRSVQEGQDHMRRGIRDSRNLDFYEAEGHFIEDYTMEVKGEKIRGQKIFIVAGARPSIPPIKGIDRIDYLTNESVLKLNKSPRSMAIVGGGYIAAEYSHFFAAMGTKVTILQRNIRLVPDEEPEISELLRRELGKRMDIYTNTEVTEAKKIGDNCIVVGRDRGTRREKSFEVEKVMIASGRTSNADLLKVENTGVEVDERGFIKANEYLETNKKNIWALGDVIGKEMFKHVANREAGIAWHNSMHEHKVKMDYLAAPHAVFSHPQIASVGLTEEQAKKDHKILVGKARYFDVAKGEAMMETEGFAKAIIERDTGKVLGFHIIGPEAPTVIQEVINAMANQGDIWSINQGMHIHPALPELILAAFQDLREPSP
jgi:dihydrolipoamide dehydrogenase